MKIARVIARLNVGGPAVHAVLLTQGLNDATMQSWLVTGRVSEGEADMVFLAKRYGVSPIVLPRLAREISWLDDLATLWRLYWFFRRERPDIVHTHTAKAGALGRLAGLLARVPVLVHTFHGHIFSGYFGRCATAGFIWIERLLARFTDRIVVISERQLQDLSHTYRIAPREKFAVIPLGFDLTPFLAIERHERAQSDGEVRPLVIGVVGRMVPVKNHELAIRICERVIRQKLFTNPIRLVMIGDGPLRGRLEHQVAEAGLEDIVTFEGWQSDLAKVYEGLDLVLLTSVNEGTPVALIEAMASGLPFVATSVGGVPDLMVGEGKDTLARSAEGRYTVYENGLLIESGDTAGGAAALAALAADASMRRHLGDTGRRFVRDRYTKERLVKDVRTLYLDLTRKAGARVRDGEHAEGKTCKNSRFC